MKKSIKNVIVNVVTILLALSVLFVGVMLVSGTKGYAVVSNSMYPNLKKGDGVFVHKTEFSQLKEGDIVTVSFKKGGGTYTHRIYEIDYENKIIVTKGDNIPETDRETAEEKQIVGKVLFSVPLVGYVSMYITDVRVVAAIGIILLLLMTATAVLRSQKKPRGDKNDE